MTKRPSKGLTFLLSLCTGVGHMYLGAMTRGLQFLLLFFGSLALADYLPFTFFPFWIPVIWFYGLFDAMQLAGREVVEDKPLVEWESLRGPRLGYALIALGVLFAAGELLAPIGLNYLGGFLRGWTSVRTLFVAIILIIVGFFMLKGKKVRGDE